MFCEECGTKNKKSANFCESCGAKLKIEEKNEMIKTEVLEPKKTSKEPSYKEIKAEKKTSGKKKFLITFLIVILIILIAASLIFAHSLKPKSVAEKYFVALMGDDSDELYKYLGVDNKGITSKKIFEEVYDNEEDDELLNYKVTSETIGANELEATVTIQYTLKDSSKTREETINLVKDKNKTLLFFDKWIIGNKDSIVISDNNLRVPKGATVKLENVTIDKSLLEKDEDRKFDNYIIPQMFKGEYNTIVTLKNGIVLTSEIQVGNSGVTDLRSLKPSENVEDELEKNLSGTIDSLYASAIADKKFKDISKDYKYENSDLTKLEETYNDFQDSLSNDLTKFKVTEVDITSCEVTDEGYLKVTADVEYDYTVTYTFFGDKETKNNDSDDKMNFVFDYYNNEYKLVEVDSMATYFSRY